MCYPRLELVFWRFQPVAVALDGLRGEVNEKKPYQRRSGTFTIRVHVQISGCDRGPHFRGLDGRDCEERGRRSAHGYASSPHDYVRENGCGCVRGRLACGTPFI